jgi:hypothetical protein
MPSNVVSDSAPRGLAAKLLETHFEAANIFMSNCLMGACPESLSDYLFGAEVALT